MAGEPMTLPPRRAAPARRRALAVSVAILAALLAAFCGAWWAAVDHLPVVPAAQPWTLTDLSRVKAMIGDELRRGTARERVLTLTQRDLEILATQAGRGLGAPRFAVELSTGRARLRASFALPRGVPGAWLNIDARLNDTYGIPAVDSLKVGALPLPAWAAEALVGQALQRLFGGSDAAARIVQRTSFVRGQVKLALDWRDDSARTLAASMLSPTELARWRAYADTLAELTRQRPALSAAPMIDFVGPLFALAQRRGASGAAAEENRAALLVLTLYANRRSLAVLLPQARGWPEPRPLSLTLNSRTDTPLHFLISAAIAAEAGGPLADTVGLYKEASDAQGGSGFSFNDLAADRAGTRFGLLLVRSAGRMQQLLAGSLAERDLMPEVEDLPEGLSAPDFARRFDRVGTPEYERLIREIDARIDRCRVYAAFGSRS